jgi:hypothetical protein
MKAFINKITYSGIGFAKNSHERKCVLIINRMSLILSLLMLMFIGLVPVLHTYQMLFFSVPFFFAFSLAPFFNAKGWLNFSKWFFCFIPVVCLVIICFFNSINLGDRFFFFTTATIPIILFRKTWVVYSIFYVSVAAFLFTSWYQGTHKPLTEIPKEFESQYYYFTLISVFAILFYVIRYFKGDSEDYEKEVEEKNAIITEKNKEVRESIEYASRIQRALQTSEKYIDKELNRMNKN